MVQKNIRLKDLPPPPPGKTGWPWTEDCPPVNEPLPLISIITPSYQQAAFIEETIRSVLLQGYPALEYVIIDGGSTDGTMAIVKKYAPFISYYCSEPDRGQSDAINKGLARVKGEVVNWLNSDDYYVPNALVQIGRSFAAGEPLAVCGRCLNFGDGYASYLSPGTDLYPLLAKTIGWARIDQPSAFFHAEAVEKMGQVNTNLHYCMIREWWIQFLVHFHQTRVLQVPDVFVNFRLHTNSKTVQAQVRFARDRDSIFHGIAHAIGQTHIANLISAHRELLPYYHFPFKPDAAYIEQLEPALHYYLLWLGMECYEALHLKLALEIWQRIDTKFLLAPDLQMLNRLRTRANWIPPGLLRWLRHQLHRR